MRQIERMQWLWEIANYRLSQDRFISWLCFFHGAAKETLRLKGSLRVMNDVTEEHLFELFNMESA